MIPRIISSDPRKNGERMTKLGSPAKLGKCWSKCKFKEIKCNTKAATVIFKTTAHSLKWEME